MKSAAVLLAEGFEEVEALTSVDYLRRAGIDVTVVGVTGMEVTGGHDITVKADVMIERYSGTPDAVIVPGGMPGAKNIADSAAAMDIIHRVSASGGVVAAICAAPAVVLAGNGFLDGKKATCFPGYEDHLENATFLEERVVVDGNVITSRGPGTAGEFAVSVIRRLAGDEAADEVHSRTLQP